MLTAGSTRGTLIPNDRTSTARLEVMPSRPNFDAWYSPSPGSANTPPTDDTWMMCPWP